MSAAATQPQCGWCPLLLPDDPAEWAHHHLTAHRNPQGYSVRFVAASDWDIGELLPAPPPTPIPDPPEGDETQ